MGIWTLDSFSVFIRETLRDHCTPRCQLSWVSRLQQLPFSRRFFENDDDSEKCFTI